MLNKNHLVIFILVSCTLMLQSCFCYKGSSTEYGQPRKEIIVKNQQFDITLLKEIDTLAVYELITYIRNDNVYVVDNSRGKSYFRFYSNGKFGAFGLGYDSDEFKLIPDYKISREDFNPLHSQMGYYFTKNNKIYTKRLTMNQCQIQVYESELVIKENIIEEISLQQKRSKNIYVKRSIPKEFLENWQPDW